MKLTRFKKVAKVAHFTDFFLHACSVYSHFEFELKNNNTIFTVSKIQAMRKHIIQLQPSSQGSFLP